MKLTKDSYFIFPGGEVHYKLDRSKSATWHNVIMQDYSMNGLMALAQHVQMMNNERREVEVTYPYFPYARQDRFTNETEPFSLKVFCDFLNSLKLDMVTIFDAHSDVTPALINNCRFTHQWEIAKKAMPMDVLDKLNVLFISPDAGAYKKVSKLVPDDQRIAIGVKNRDTSTGKITHTDVFSPVPIEGRHCVIVDDICDGGRTFIGLAKTLKSKGAKKIYLYVTHGIFSNGFEELRKYIDHIYTTNSFPQPKDDYITVEEIV
jgi:ribose-phosphate pyrophosphokinase